MSIRRFATLPPIKNTSLGEDNHTKPMAGIYNAGWKSAPQDLVGSKIKFGAGRREATGEETRARWQYYAGRVGAAAWQFANKGKTSSD
jgi:hypothetical protein